ncbi:unnamed protein product [Arabis nemorensis]|uniref:Uncharacterized protein n=1 Tax=Arabis nemorensis TaxID=586526 RepID=A0A565AVM2_9BRAS|nr:unnamed protein product [Arabis nemorensis]
MEGKMLKKCSTSTTDAVKKLKRKKSTSVKKKASVKKVRENQRVGGQEAVEHLR